MKSDIFAPVAVFVYNRLDHFKLTFDALSKNFEAEKTDLFIFSDGAKTDKDIENVNAVREFLDGIENSNSFKSVTVVKSDVNKGLAQSIITGVNHVLTVFDRIIVLEDDCVTSPYFLSFMNKSLDYFSDDMRVGSIAGYTPQFDFPVEYKYDVFSSYRSCSCGWATWRNRFTNIDWSLKDRKDKIFNSHFIRKFNSSGSDRFIRLYRQLKGDKSSWSVRFGANLVLNNQLTVYPRYSYISNIGCDESGVHSKSEDSEKMKVNLDLSVPDPDIKFIPPDKNVIKRFKKQYSGGLISDIKRGLYILFICVKERLCK